MKEHEEKYLVSVIASLLFLYIPAMLYDLGYEFGLWRVFQEEVGWQDFEYGYKTVNYTVFPLLAMIGSFLYLWRRKVPLKTRFLFLLLNPVTLFFFTVSNAWLKSVL